MKLIYSLLSLFLATSLLTSCGNRDAKKEEKTVQTEETKADSTKIAAGVYTNDQLGYQITYPKDILSIQEGTENSGEQVFLPKEGKAKLRIYKDERKNKAGEPLTLNEAFDLDRESTNKRQVVYNSLKPLFTVISGVEGDEIFYQKTIISNNALITAKLTYYKEDKPTYDAMLSSLFDSFR